MSSLEIIQVVREVHPFGGASGVAHNLKVQFDRLKIPNTLITLEKPSTKQKKLGASKIQLLVDVVRFTFTSTTKLWLLSKQPNQIVIVHNDAIGGDIYVDHGLHKAVVLGKPTMFLRNPLHAFLFLREELRHWLKNYRYIVALSEYSENLIIKHYTSIHKEDIVRIPNGVDVEGFKSSRDECKTKGLKLIFIGHEFERKGLEYCIDALKYLHSSVTLSVVGGGDADVDTYIRLAVAAGVRDRINFFGKRKDIKSLLAGHDILLLPSRFESWQLVVLEAMAAGVPVIGTPVGCAPEVIEDGLTGFIVTQSGPDIARKIKLIYDAPELLKAMRINAVKISEKYTWQIIADKYVQLANRILEERSAHVS